MMADGSGGASRMVLLSLFWALQGSLLSWCYLQLKGTSSTAATADLARAILVKCEIPYDRPTNEMWWNWFCNKWPCVWISSTHKKKSLFNSLDVDQFLGSIKATLGSLLERYTGAEITDKLGSSILATLFRQQVLHSYCDLNIFFQQFFLFFFLLRNYWFDYNISCGPGRSFYSWSCAFWTSLTVYCWRASPLWWSYSEAYPPILETSFRRSVKSQHSPAHILFVKMLII